eukprot:jgi/Botrbrau1/3550/Bobra.0078s0007.1
MGCGLRVFWMSLRFGNFSGGSSLKTPWLHWVTLGALSQIPGRLPGASKAEHFCSFHSDMYLIVLTSHNHVTRINSAHRTQESVVNCHVPSYVELYGGVRGTRNGPAVVS